MQHLHSKAGETLISWFSNAALYIPCSFIIFTSLKKDPHPTYTYLSFTAPYKELEADGNT